MAEMRKSMPFVRRYDCDRGTWWRGAREHNGPQTTRSRDNRELIAEDYKRGYGRLKYGEVEKVRLVTVEFIENMERFEF
jgi:hypothetical protein